MADEPAPTTSFYQEHAAAIWTILLAGPVLVLLGGLVLAPEVFYDQFLWKHIVGPSVADAHQQRTAQYDGVVAVEGYTLVSELVYGVVLAVLLYGIYVHILKRYQVRTRGRFLVALLPLIILGPLARVLEDADVFLVEGVPTPFAYLFISPWIYFQIAAFAIAFILLAVLVERARDLAAPEGPLHGDRLPLAIVASFLGIETFVYAALVTRFEATFAAVASPLVVLGTALVALLIFRWGLQRWGPDRNLTIFVLGLPVVAPPAALVARWLLGGWWASGPRLGVLHLDAGAAMFGLAIAVTLLTYLVARGLRGDNPTLGLFAGGTNLALIFGHMLDGFATYLALVDPFGFGLPAYGEKHPVSAYLLEFGDGLAFPVAKFLLIAVIIYLLDQELKPDLEDEDLVGLVKIAVFTLGFAPGLRDVARVAMGT